MGGSGLCFVGQHCQYNFLFVSIMSGHLSLKKAPTYHSGCSIGFKTKGSILVCPVSLQTRDVVFGSLFTLGVQGDHVEVLNQLLKLKFAFIPAFMRLIYHFIIEDIVWPWITHVGLY